MRICVCVHCDVCVYVHTYECSTPVGQKGASDPLKLKLTNELFKGSTYF